MADRRPLTGRGLGLNATICENQPRVGARKHYVLVYKVCMRGIVLSSRRFFASALLGASLVALSAPALAQTDEQRAGARSLATEGALAFNEGRFKDAIDLFSKAESLVHAPPHLLFMARAYAKLGQLVKAREAYMKVVKEQLSPSSPQAFRDAQVTAEEERKLVEPKIGRLVIKVEGADTAKDLSVSVDGQPISAVLLGVPQPMDPGTHTVTASATGFKAQPASVTLKEAERGAVTVKMEVDASAPPPPAAPIAAPAAQGTSFTTDPGAPPSDAGPSGGRNGLRIGSYVGFGVGVVGVALGTVFVLKSSSKRKEADEAAAGCPCDDRSELAQKISGLDDDARSAQTLGIVGFVVGGVGIATGVTLFVLSSKKEPSKSAYVRPFVGLGSVGVQGAF